MYIPAYCIHQYVYTYKYKMDKRNRIFLKTSNSGYTMRDEEKFRDSE